MAYVGFFTSDRAQKYGWGLPRLLVLTVLSFELAPRLSSVVIAATSRATHDAAGIITAGSVAALGLKSYFASGRWLGHFYVGSIGAVVNVEVLPLAFNLALLGGAAAFLIHDVVTFDYAALVYLAKTFSGDFLAGKLDTTEWRLVLAFSITIWAVCWAMASGRSSDGSSDGYSSGGASSGSGDSSSSSRSESARAVLWDPYSRILPALFLIQLVCEIGDAYFENLLFFRHRYSFESFTALVLFALPNLTPAELRVVQLDLVTCLGYRASNFIVILYRSQFFTSKNLEIALRKTIFRLFGWLRGTPLVNVSDLEVALAVLRASNNKGAALERYVATPAWRPILSLESVDGALWKGMLADFHKVLAVLPAPAHLQQLAEKHAAVLSSSANIIDAEAITKWSIAVFAEFVWGAEVGGHWCPELETIALASWEWRKEIAVRGKADRQIKANAVAACIALTRKCPKLWALLGEDQWTKPRGYSLLLQPFFLSPAINVGDIAVALQTFPTLNVEEAMRQMHPFPILERFVQKDILSKDGATVLVKGGTQVIMFTNDFVPKLAAEADKKKDDGDGNDSSSSSSSIGNSGSIGSSSSSSSTSSLSSPPASSPPSSSSSSSTLKRNSSSDRLTAMGLPAYGAGPRQCAGAHLARPLLKVLETKLRSSPNFKPEIGHKHSGRNNDGNVSMTEMLYFARTVLPVLFTFRRSGNEKDDGDGSDSAAVEAAANVWSV